MSLIFPLMLLCALSLFGITLGFAWSDAKKRGKSPILVTLLVVCSFPLGLLAWLVFRPDLPTPINPERKFDLETYRLQ